MTNHLLSQRKARHRRRKERRHFLPVLQWKVTPDGDWEAFDPNARGWGFAGRIFYKDGAKDQWVIREDGCGPWVFKGPLGGAKIEFERQYFRNKRLLRG